MKHGQGETEISANTGRIANDRVWRTKAVRFLKQLQMDALVAIGGNGS